MRLLFLIGKKSNMKIKSKIIYPLIISILLIIMISVVLMLILSYLGTCSILSLLDFCSRSNLDR